MKKSSPLYPLEPDLTEYIDCTNVYDSCPVCRRGLSNPNINAFFLKEEHTIFLYSKEGRTRPNTNIIDTIFNLLTSTKLARNCIGNLNNDLFLFLETFNYCTVETWVSSLED